MKGSRRLIFPGLLCILSWFLMASALESETQQAARLLTPEQTPAPLSCENTLSDEICEAVTNCLNDARRRGCRRSCNACQSYEVENTSELQYVASVVGSMHITTFDKVRYDCNGVGEYALLENGANNLRMHALVEKTQPGGEVSVIKGIAMQDDSYKKVQISMNQRGSAAATDVSQCRVKFFLDGTRVIGSPFMPGGFFGLMGKRHVNSYRLQYKDSVDVRFQLRFHPNLGCFFDSLTVRLDNSRLTEETRGMLGTPNNDFADDLITEDGTIASPSMGASRFEEWYQYCSNNWCIGDISESLFVDATDELKTTCNSGAVYSGVDLTTASSAIVESCGADDACLVDAVAMSDQVEGLSTLLNTFQIGLSNRFISRFSVWRSKVLLNVQTFVRLRIRVRDSAEMEDVESYNIYFVNARGIRTNRPPVLAGRKSRLFFQAQTTVRLTLRNPALGFEAVPVVGGVELGGTTRKIQRGSRQLGTGVLSMKDAVTIATPTAHKFFGESLQYPDLRPFGWECQDFAEAPERSSEEICRILDSTRSCALTGLIRNLCPLTCQTCTLTTSATTAF